MKITNKEDIANFIESHLKELGGEAYGINYISEKLFEWHESEFKNLRLGDVVERSEQLPERLCKNNPNFKCNCIDQDRCPNFSPY